MHNVSLSVVCIYVILQWVYLELCITYEQWSLQVARKVVEGIQYQKSYVSIPWFWNYFFLLVKNMFPLTVSGTKFANRDFCFNVERCIFKPPFLVLQIFLLLVYHQWQTSKFLGRYLTSAAMSSWIRVFANMIQNWAVFKKTDTKWNSSTICGTVSQKMWNSSQKVEQVLKAITVPQKVEQFHNLWNSSS